MAKGHISTGLSWNIPLPGNIIKQLIPENLLSDTIYIKMYESLCKYFRSSTILHQSTMELSKVEVPDIYICNSGPYSNSKSSEHGFKYKSDFLAGIKKGFETATWNDGDMDFDMLLNTLYSVNENNFETLRVKTTIDDEES